MICSPHLGGDVGPILYCLAPLWYYPTNQSSMRYSITPEIYVSTPGAKCTAKLGQLCLLTGDLPDFVWRFELNRDAGITVKMLPEVEAGLVREAGTILAIYLSTLLTGYSTGFSAVAVPDIKVERRWER